MKSDISNKTNYFNCPNIDCNCIFSSSDLSQILQLNKIVDLNQDEIVRGKIYEFHDASLFINLNKQIEYEKIKVDDFFIDDSKTQDYKLYNIYRVPFNNNTKTEIDQIKKGNF